MLAKRPITEADLVKPTTFCDPYPVYLALRDRSPVRYMMFPAAKSPDKKSPVWAWALLKYEHVHNVLRDYETFSSDDPFSGMFRPKLVMVVDHPLRHHQFRGLLQGAFTTGGIEAFVPSISSIANELLDKIGQGVTDIVSSYASSLPGRVIARLLGLPENEHATFKRWADQFISTGETKTNERSKDMQQMMEYFSKMIAKRRKGNGGKDLISILAESTIDRVSLQEWEVLGYCILLLIAGNLTTRHLIGNMFNILAARPDLWRRLREDRSLVEPVIEETLRYESPAQRLPRTATCNVEISGVKISKGDRVVLFFGAANRDPIAFPNPDAFDINRNVINHVAFGTGRHHCMGAPLARTEAKITLNAFLDRFSVIKHVRDAAVRQRASAIVFGFEQLPLLVKF